MTIFDLTLKNWVKNKSDEICQVEALEITQESVLLSDGLESWQDSSTIKPIEIIDSWLLDNGFVYDSGRFINKSIPNYEVVIYKHLNMYNCLIFKIGKELVGSLNIKYIHEYQNITKAVFKKDLELKFK